MDILGYTEDILGYTEDILLIYSILGRTCMCVV